jgi:calcineurin-like phosphoesterase family protein
MRATELLPEQLILTDVDYVVSDLHLNHENIIKYCRSETFALTEEGLDDMNWTLLGNWNRTVDPDETIVFVGDFAWLRGSDRVTQRKIDNLWATLNGQKIFIRGDHDYVTPSSVEEWTYAVAIQHEGEAYFVSHFPGDTPASLPGGGMPDEFAQQLPENYAERLDGWRIHGHHHNNWPEEYPLVNPDRRTINCSVELTGYRPLSMDRVKELVTRDEWIHSV